MPAFHTHFFIARETLKRFPDPIREKIQPYLPLYFFGAQGADFCFFYPIRSGFSQNLGSYLHRKGGYGAFTVCKAFASQPSLFAYSLGYITHYAADTVFHPYVYHLAGRSPLRHTRIEGAFDAFFKARYPQETETAEFLRPKLSARPKNDLFLLYAAISARVGFPPLDKKAFYRAISLFNAYLPLSSRSLGAKNSALVNALAAKGNLFFERALRRSLAIGAEFCLAVKNKTSLSYEVFGKSYLTDEHCR
ncbi:MAG: zinc dependent phospholipase C family protein [Clostridia bacterium]|nr:zinc dependent phospholipase C family protein [Clostridia bacterium]